MSLVGLDVHAAQTHAAILNTATGELRGVKLRMVPTAVVKFLSSLPSPVRAVYEAGPTGSGWPGRRSIAASTFVSSRRARCHARRMIASRPTSATLSASRGCWPPVSCVCVCAQRRRRAVS
jgi:hypothetical protein